MTYDEFWNLVRSTGWNPSAAELRQLLIEAEMRQLQIPALDDLASRIAVLVTSCRDKEPPDLTEHEQLALAILGGCAWERTETGIRVTDPFGIQKINGKFIVCRGASQLGELR